MSKTRDTGYLANVIQVHDTGVRIMSGSEMLMAISSSGQVTITGELSGSDAANSLLLDGTGSLAFTTTASFLVVSASQQQISSSYISLSGSYNTFSGSASTRITVDSASLLQVSSSQQQISSSLLQVSASYIALSGSYTTFSGSASTRVTQIEQVYATTGSNSFRANQSITGSLVVSSTITAQTLVVQTVTSSIVYSSGSNIFGSALGDRQTFTGSMNITGSTILNGVLTGTSATFVGNVSTETSYIKYGTSIGSGPSTPTYEDAFTYISNGLCSKIQGGTTAGWNSDSYLKISTSSGSLILGPSGAAIFSNSVTAAGTIYTTGGTAGDVNAVAIKVDNNKYQSFYNVAATGWAFSLGADTSNNGLILANCNMIFGTGASATEKMRITCTGDLWFTGRSTTANYQSVFYNDNSQFAINATNTSTGKTINFNPSNTLTAMAITSTGNVCIGSTASTTYGTLNIVQQSVCSPSFVRGIELVHPNGTGGTGGYIGISMTGQKQGTIQVGDDAATGDLLLQSQGGNVGIGTATTPRAILSVEQDITTTAEFGSFGQFNIGGKTNANKNLSFGFNTATDVGFIQAMVNGTSYNNLLLNARGGNVGIGTTSPTQLLSLSSACTLGTAVNIINTSTGGYNWNIFSEGSDATKGPVGSLIFRDSTNGVSRMTISSAGNVGIGTCSLVQRFTIAGSYVRMESRSTDNTNAGVYYTVYNGASVVGQSTQAVTNTGDYIISTGTSSETERFRISGTGNTCIFCQLSTGPYITIGNQGGTDTTVIGGGSGAGSQIRMNYAGGSYNNFLAGNGDNYFNCLLGKLNAAGGVKFGSGATTLNYYEQGTWTPRLKNGSFTTNAGVGNAGWYTRIGNLVTVGGTLDWGAGSGAQDGNSLQIACLPFASSNTSNERNVGQFGAPAASSIGFKCTTKGQFVLVNDPGASYIYLIETFQDGTYSTYTHNPCVANAGTLYGFQITYHTL